LKGHTIAFHTIHWNGNEFETLYSIVIFSPQHDTKDENRFPRGNRDN